ncbi:MAG: hypothetical protein KAV82_15770, partial [Phycisphaerae bacterium]|nr:hypothetical protein [Phycisphaerae bacterium]
MKDEEWRYDRVRLFSGDKSVAFSGDPKGSVGNGEWKNKFHPSCDTTTLGETRPTTVITPFSWFSTLHAPLLHAPLRV